MENLYCNHCGHELEAGTESLLTHCPVCNAPIGIKLQSTKEKKSRNFIYYFIGLVIFCFVIIYIVPTLWGR